MVMKRKVRIVSRGPAEECSTAELQRQQEQDRRAQQAKQWIAQAKGQNEAGNESV